MLDFTVDSMESPTLTKAQLADVLFESIGLNKRESKDMVESFFELISQQLIAGQDVKIAEGLEIFKFVQSHHVLDEIHELVRLSPSAHVKW